jgi:pimeloyl-ACP methyl ester carboxylesterase
MLGNNIYSPRKVIKARYHTDANDQFCEQMSQVATTTVVVSGANDQAPHPQHVVNSPGYQAWYQSLVDYLTALKTQTHEERMVSSLRLLPHGVPLLPEDQYVPLVEAPARVDLDLVLLGNELWSRARQQYEEARQLQTRITCPDLLLYSEHFPTPGTPVTVREEPGERPNEKIVRFEHAGHLIYRENFEQFVAVVTAFLKEYKPLTPADMRHLCHPMNWSDGGILICAVRHIVLEAQVKD